MNIASVNSSQIFRGLDYTYVSTTDREKYIQSNFKKLNKMGKEYDIRMISCYSNVPGFSSVDIEVRPLKNGLNFFQKMLRPTGRSCFETDIEHAAKNMVNADDFMKCIDEAIADLGKKLRLHK